MTKLLSCFAIVFAVASIALAEESANQDAKTTEAAKAQETKDQAKPKEEDPEKIDWKKVDWRKRLTAAQYRVMRQADTERPFTNKYWRFFKPGEYHCAACGLALFEGDAKFESECGWPSFDKTKAKDTVTEHKDYLLGYERIEIRCRRCGSHLGHVFNDGPTKTGLRYCLNSVAMKFVPEKQLKKQAPADKKAAKPAETAVKTTEK
jgi:methionine-R-sulfoxide reductase